jgi:hypothetical protein
MSEQEKAASFREQAAKLRLEHDRAKDARIRQALAELARQYEALADWLERRK